MSDWFYFVLAATITGSLFVISKTQFRLKAALCTLLLLCAFLFPLAKFHGPFLVSGVIGALQVLIYLACYIWEKRRPSVEYEAFSKHMVKGVTYILLQPMIMTVAAISIRSALKPLIGEFHGLQFYGAPLWAQVILFTLLYDFKDYVHHWANHNFDLLWRFHKVHHSPLEVTSVSWANRSFIDMLVITAPVGTLMMILIDVQPVVFPLTLFVQFILGGPFAHANVDFPRAGTIPLWSRVFASPSFHREHHSFSNMRANYAIAFPLWDRIFGTYSMPVEIPRNFGVGSRKYSELGFFADQVAPLLPQSRFPEEPDPLINA